MMTALPLKKYNVASGSPYDHHQAREGARVTVFNAADGGTHSA